MPILTENTDRPACLPRSKDEPFLPSIKNGTTSPRGAPPIDSSRENKQNAGSNVKGNTSSRKSGIVHNHFDRNNNKNNNNSDSYEGNAQRSIYDGDVVDETEKRDKYFPGANNYVCGFRDEDNGKKDSLSRRLGQLQTHGDSGPVQGNKAFFSAPASESSTPFKLPSIDRSKSNSVSSLVSDRNLQHRNQPNLIRGQSRDRRSRFCRSPSCPSNLGCYWIPDDESDFSDDDDNRNSDNRAYKNPHVNGQISTMITPDTARLPPGDRLLGFSDGLNTTHSQKSEGKISPSPQSSSRPCFGHREDSCTATNSSIRLPSIFPSRGSHNSSFLTTGSSINGFGMGAGNEDPVTADSSAVTSRDGSPFAFKREPTFFNMSHSRQDNAQSYGTNNSSNSCSFLSPDVATRAAAKLSLTAHVLSPRHEVPTEYDDQESPSLSNITSTRSSHQSGYQHQCSQLQHGQQHPQSNQQQQNQMQQSSALLLPITSTADSKSASSSYSTHALNGGGSNGGKRKRKKNGTKCSSHGLGDLASDAATERLLREKLGAIERRDNEGYSPTRESAQKSVISKTACDDHEPSDMNLIERVKNETDERNNVTVGTRDRDSKMSGIGEAAGDGINAKPPSYQSTPSRIKTEKKVAPLKA
ncbi:hypothetical protein EGW08_014101 [Elysia chlorotica]|uniref:Uncharacterized protein n=1 Tax=Elysia chlorotica TaxID=188477 RepID=A0A3S1B968_ELYCH|nr:hypothetical protein EGW08_014101 [Elysia chlorotica]